eukprot:scaffold604_cov384-Prasinococcus_capsulatus_cf.AAC.35
MGRATCPPPLGAGPVNADARRRAQDPPLSQQQAGSSLVSVLVLLPGTGWQSAAAGSAGKLRGTSL